MANRENYLYLNKNISKNNERCVNLTKQVKYKMTCGNELTK